MAETEGGICRGKMDLPEVIGWGETRYFVCAVWSKASAVVDIELGKFEGGGAGDGGAGWCGFA